MSEKEERESYEHGRPESEKGWQHSKKHVESSYGDKSGHKFKGMTHSPLERHETQIGGRHKHKEGHRIGERRK